MSGYLNLALEASISRGIRGLLAGGRVYLKTDMAAKADVVPVGRALDDPTSELDGWKFFNQTTTSALLVEPGDEDEPDSVDHQEAVTIDTDTFVRGTTKDILLAAKTTYGYTAAAGAYIRPATLPAASVGIKFIQNDFIPAELMDPVLSEWLPGVLVSFRGRKAASWSSGEIGFTYFYRVYACDVIRNDRDNSAWLTAWAEGLSDLVLEDHTLGGWVIDSDIGDLVPWHESATRATGIRFFTTQEDQVGWAQFDVTAFIPRLWNKSYPMT